MENGLLSGKTIGRYQIKALLGRGGMAEVYRAYDALLEREVAVKMIRAEKGSDETFLKRFEREARAIAQLQFPHIVRVHDAGEAEGNPYLVMDYLSGGTLKQYLERSPRPLPYCQAARLLAPIARALEYAHQQGILHRDVKPANILLTPNGEPMLSDFGIAKILEGEESAQLTGMGMGIGTPAYMAPEQWKGNACKQSDIYALGVMFYEMVAGVCPYTANTPAGVMLKHLTAPLTPARQHAPGLPPQVDEILSRALAKEPAGRYTDMGSFAADLEKLAQEDKPLIVFAKRKTEKGASAAPARSGAVWAAGGAGLALGGLTALCIFAALWLVVSRTAAPALVTNAQQPSILNPLSAGAQPTLDLTRVNENLSQRTRAPFASISGLPPGIPILSENNGDLTVSGMGENTTQYAFSTHLPMDKVISFYETGLQEGGWTFVFGNDTSAAQMVSKSFNYQRTRRAVCADGAAAESAEALTLFVSLIESNPDTYVSLMYYKGGSSCENP